MALYNNILESVKFIAGGVASRRQKAPIAHVNSGRGMTSIQSGNELQVSAIGTVYSCLQLRANGLTSVDFNAYKELNWEKQELSNAHWVNRLLSNPNPFFTHSQIFKAVQNWHDVNGNAFIWTPRMGYEYPLQMWVLNPTRMRVVVGGDNFIQEYIYQSANNGAFRIDEKEIIHLANLFPSSTKPDELIGMNIFGKSLVSAVLPYANIDNEVSEYLQRLFVNDAVPPIIATSPDRVDGEFWDSLKNKWNESLPNYQLKALLDGGMQLALPPDAQIQTSYDSVSKDVRAQISQVFGVPSGLLTGEFQNRATAEVQYAVFRQQTIDPVAKYIAEELTRHFRRFEDDILIEAEPYDFTDTDQQIKKEEFELKYGIKTINDARRERGYDTIKDGDVPMIAGGLIPVNTVVSPPQLPSVQPRAFQGAKSGIVLRLFPMQTAEAKAEYWNQYDAVAEKIAVKLQSVIQELMASNGEGMIQDVLQGLDIQSMPLTQAQIDEISNLVDSAYLQVTEELTKDFGIMPSDLSGEFGQAMSQMAYDTNALIVASVEGGNEEITLSMKKEIMQLTADNADLNDKQLSELLTAKYTKLSASRSRTIARTTATSVTTGSQMLVFKDVGAQYIWMTERDSRVRPSHARMDGKKTNNAGFFEVDSTYMQDGAQITEKILVDRPVGNDAGGKPIPAREAVNCRCYLFPILNK